MNVYDQRNAVAAALRRLFGTHADEVTTEDLGGATQTIARARRHRWKRSIAICEPIAGRIWTVMITRRNDVTIKRAASPTIALETACCEYEASQVVQVAL